MHQQHLAGSKRAAIDQPVIGSAVRGKKRRTLGIIEIRRQRRELRFRHHRLVGVGAMTHLDDEQTRERAPFDWARTQTNLGNALAMLGERESGTTKLEEAVAAYRERRSRKCRSII